MIKKSVIIISVLFTVSLLIIKIYYSSVTTPRPASPQTSISPLLSLLSPISSPRFAGEAGPTPPKTVSFLAVGDIMLGRYVNFKMIKEGSWQYPFLKTNALTSSADIAFGNLESPFAENCPTTTTGMVFCARKEAVEGLKVAGFDLLSLANNHILNYGQPGLEFTKKLLNENEIKFSDSNNLTIQQFNNIKFGFLSYDLVSNPSLPREALAKWGQISQTSPTVDILIVSLHWGNEYLPPTQKQKQLARQIIDAGAKIIIGHHPHVIQPIEEYHNGLIFYSLGNFVFDQPWSEPTKKGLVAKIIFEGKEIKSYEAIPVYIENLSQPRISQ